MIINGQNYKSLTLTDKRGNVIFSISDDDIIARTEGIVYFEESEGQVRFRTNDKKIKAVAEAGTPYLELKKAS